MTCGSMINLQQNVEKNGNPEKENTLERYDSFLFLSLGIKPNVQPTADLQENPCKSSDSEAEVETEDKKISDENIASNSLPSCAFIPPLDGFVSTPVIPSQSTSESGEEPPKEAVEDNDQAGVAQCVLPEVSNSLETEPALFPNQTPIPHRSCILDLVNRVAFPTSPASKELSDSQTNASETENPEVIEDQCVPENENGGKKRKRLSLLASKKKKHKFCTTYLAEKKRQHLKNDGHEYAKPTAWLFCEYCFKKIANKSLLMLHIRKHRDPDYWCGNCGEEVRGDKKKFRNGYVIEVKDGKKRDLVAKRAHALRCSRKSKMIQRYFTLKSSKNGIVDPFDVCEIVLDKSDEQ